MQVSILQYREKFPSQLTLRVIVIYLICWLLQLKFSSFTHVRLADNIYTYVVSTVAIGEHGKFADGVINWSAGAQILCKR